jgi:hypothetical protein
MVWLKGHVSWRDLNRLADDELEADARVLAIEHVAACPKCTGRVSFLESMRDAGRDMRHPAPPHELLEDILRSRSEGARVILPAIPAPPSRRRRVLPAAAAAAIVAGLAFLVPLFLASEAGAGASELTFDPPRPVPGEEVRLTYRPTTELAGEPELRVRLHLRQPDSEPPRGALPAHDEVTLLPDGDGRYTGSFRLPPDVAYTVMAVESPSGDRVDDRDGRLWDLRAHSDDGTPSLGAVRQEFLVLEHRSWPEAGEVLHDMTVLYPERAEGWSRQLLHDRPAQLPDEEAAGRAKHRELFRGLQSEPERFESSVEETAAMARYANALEDSTASREWMTRLEALDPAHRLVVTVRLVELGDDPTRADAYLERLWSDEGPNASVICWEGFQIAERAGDLAGARRWAVRGLQAEKDAVRIRDMALALVANPATRERGVSAIRDLVFDLSRAADEERSLHLTSKEVAEESEKLQAILLVDLARRLLAVGEVDAAIAELEAADALGEWLPDLYRTRLEARLLAGDAQAARADFHRLDADPIYSRESIDSLRHRIPPMSTPELRSGREQAERDMRERVLANQDNLRGLPTADLYTSTGQARTLESLVAGRPTVLMFWDRRLLDPGGGIEEVIRARNLLAGGVGQLLWITPEPDSESLQAFTREAGLGVPVYHDPGAMLATSLGEWGSSGYYVIDRAGMIRARTNSLMEAVRHLEVLQLGSRDSA